MNTTQKITYVIPRRKKQCLDSKFKLNRNNSPTKLLITIITPDNDDKKPKLIAEKVFAIERKQTEIHGRTIAKQYKRLLATIARTQLNTTVDVEMKLLLAGETLTTNSLTH